MIETRQRVFADTRAIMDYFAQLMGSFRDEDDPRPLNVRMSYEDHLDLLATDHGIVVYRVTPRNQIVDNFAICGTFSKDRTALLNLLVPVNGEQSRWERPL